MATPEAVVLTENEQLAGINADYTERYGFHDAENYLYKAPKGLTRELVEKISEFKSEPQWMRDFRLKALDHFLARPMPTWGSPLLAEVNFDDIHYFVRASERVERSWDDVPDDVKKTFDRLGIPEAERKFLSGVGAQYESEVVYHQVNEELEKQGVIFMDMDSALREHEDLVRQYFATIIPPNDNKLAALSSAVWSGGSFVYVPAGVHVEMPLQAYFRINTENMGQFERTIIIAEPGSYVHYVEGCTAPTYSSDSLHSAVVELIALPGARIRYTTVQNWSTNVYNLVTKRAGGGGTRGEDGTESATPHVLTGHDSREHDPQRSRGGRRERDRNGLTWPDRGEVRVPRKRVTRRPPSCRPYGGRGPLSRGVRRPRPLEARCRRSFQRLTHIADARRMRS